MFATSFFFVTACLSITNDSESYGAALAQAQQHQQPLLVLVGADWCPACRVMEQQVLPQLRRQGGLQRVSVAKVDTDRQPELARQLMRGSAIPQLIVFRQRPDGSWFRAQITGATSVGEVYALVQRAQEQVPASPLRPTVSANGH